MTTRSLSVGQMSRRSGGRVQPVRSRRGVILLMLVAISAFLILDVYLNVQRVRFGTEIQGLKRELDILGSDVRDLEGVRAGMTSLAVIEQRAREMGMVYPKRLPRTLLVEVPTGDVPPVWSLPSPRANEFYGRGSTDGQVALASTGTRGGQ